MNDVATEKKAGKSGMLIGALLVAIAILAIGGYFLYQKQNGDSMKDGGEAVATVDGEMISQAAYERSAAQIRNAFAAQGIDATSAEAEASIKEQAINTLVNRQLILNAAIEAGITATDEQVETEYQTIVSNMGGEENLKATLDESGATVEEFRNDLRSDIIINTYLEQELGTSAVVVTDEEVRAAYDASAETAGEANVPSFEEVAELIRGQLNRQKQEELISAELDRLRAEAEIEVTLE